MRESIGVRTHWFQKLDEATHSHTGFLALLRFKKARNLKRK